MILIQSCPAETGWNELFRLIMAIRLFFSNTIETLTRSLADEITRHRDPFNPPAIMVPNPYMRKWIQMKLAELHGISMNINFHVLNDGLKIMMDQCNPQAEKPSILEQKDIQLLLYHALASIDPVSSPARPLAEYLYTRDHTRKVDYDHRLFQLASRLSRYFMEYELYREEMVRSWLEGRLTLDMDMESAQQHLYHALFRKNGYRDSIKKNWLTLPQYFGGSVLMPPRGLCPEFFIFGESHLSPFHARLLYELGKHISISVYQMNPCSEFWEDVTTPREDRWQRVRSIRIDKTPDGDSLNYGENENPLLKLWGRTGRETMKLLSLIEEAGSRERFCSSDWITSDRPQAGITALGTVQDQILRRTTMTDALARISQDTSIQVASCPELFREVESVYNSILYNLERDPTLKMTDIAVMVPDMELYGPVIHSVFSREPRRLACSMIDSTAAADSLFSRAVLSLLKIAAGSFTRKEISDLLRNSCFYEAHALTLADVLVWLSWADNLNIFREFKKTDELDPAQNLHTWQQGLLRLRFGRIMDTRQSSVYSGEFLSFRNIVPYSDIHTGDQRLIDAISGVIELVHVRTAGLTTLEITAAEWVRLITGLIAEFLTVPVHKPEEKSIYGNLMECLDRLTILDRLPGPGSARTLSFTAIQEFIAETLTGIASSQGSYLSTGINISALVPKRQIPFRIIYIMGMQEGIFPGSSDRSTLNLMVVSRKIGDVSRPDVNKYHFLETLLAAREKIYITYISKDLQKDQDIHPNSVTGQLITYLNNHVISNDFIMSEAPSSGSSVDYVRLDSERSPVSDFIQATMKGKFQPVSFNESDRLVLLLKLAGAGALPEAAAMSLSKKLRDRKPDFSLLPPNEREIPEAESISLGDLRYYLLNPVESVLRWHLSLYEDEVEDTASKENEPFFSVFPYNYTFIMNSLNYCLQTGSLTEIQAFIDHYYHYRRLKSDTPHGVYADIDYGKLRSDIMDQFQSPGSLLEFLQNRQRHTVYRTVTFGSVPSAEKPDLSLPSITVPVVHRDKKVSVDLKGSLPVIWKNQDTGECETLVLTNSSQPSIRHLVSPFLFYIAAAANYNRQLSDLIGSGSFTVHVVHQGGISSYPYLVDETSSRKYLQHLINDFLDPMQFDLLPLAIISDKKILAPSNMKDDPTESEQAEYRQSLLSLIDDDADKMNPAYRPLSLLQFIDPEVPADAYLKVRSRLGMLFNPFSGGDSH